MVFLLQQSICHWNIGFSQATVSPVEICAYSHFYYVKRSVQNLVNANEEDSEDSSVRYYAQKMKFSIKNFFSKCDQVRSFLSAVSKLTFLLFIIKIFSYWPFLRFLLPFLSWLTYFFYLDFLSLFFYLFFILIFIVIFFISFTNNGIKLLLRMEGRGTCERTEMFSWSFDLSQKTKFFLKAIE